MKTRLLAAIAAGALCGIGPIPGAGRQLARQAAAAAGGIGPGGGTDAMARAVADKLGPRLGQTVVVENKPGASNTLAADLAAKSGDAHPWHHRGRAVQDATGVQITHIPYRGSGPWSTTRDPETASSVIPHIKSGKVRALAVLSAARNPQLPDVPTMAEAGVPGVEMSAGMASTCPAARPPRSSAACTTRSTPSWRCPTPARLQAIGADVSPMSQEQFARFHQAENQRYAAIIKKNHISVE